LAEDADYRNQLLKLQKSWDLLDHLPRAPVADSFALSTVEMVALKAGDDVVELKQAAVQKQGLFRYLAAAGIVAGFLAGFFLVRTAGNWTDSQLVKDLPVIENVDLYDYVESVDFLSDLEKSGLFSEEISDDSL